MLLLNTIISKWLAIGNWNIPKVRVAEVVCCFKWLGQMWKFNDGKRERHTFVIKRIGCLVVVW